MKFFDVNWATVLNELDRWDALTLPARRVLLHELKMQGYVPALRFEPHLAEIINSGIAVHEPAKHRLWLGDERRALVKVLRAMGRHQLFHTPPQPGDEQQLRISLLRYMEEHFTGDEVQRIASDALKSAAYANRQTLAPFVASPSWVGELLGAEEDDALLDWADGHGLSSAGFRDDPAELYALRGLALTLLKYPDGLPLRELIAPIEDEDEIRYLGGAIHLGLASMALFAGMRAEDLEPTIGLWPSVVRELTRVASTPPAPVEVGPTFALAVHMEDMTTLLAAAAAAPVRVRANDGLVFARTRADIERRLVGLPMWVSPLLDENRVDPAAQALLARHFVQVRELDGNPHLHATTAGMQWLRRSAHDRLTELVEPLRRSKEKNPRDTYDTDRASSFFPLSLPFYQTPKSLNLRADLTRAFLQAKDVFIPVVDFLQHATRENNPLLALTGVPAGSDGALMFYSGFMDPKGVVREMWGEVLVRFLATRLIGLGGAAVGVGTNDTICFSLTDVGLYILGIADTFDYGAGAAAGDVVVQPNFDVVFLGAAPAVEAELARFSERVGVAPGHVFRITRASVLAAAESGAGVGDVIGALTRASSKAIPRNVQHEIAGWMGTVRRATRRHAELLECAHADVATRIVALLGAGVRQITPLIVELPDLAPAARAAMMKKLRAGGVFIDEAQTSPDLHRGAHRR
ncbi:hypothetical protein BH09GEM1_BH09GEM1_18470 [soil metagenome]